MANLVGYADDPSSFQNKFSFLFQGTYCWMRMYVDGLYVEGVCVYIRVGQVTAVVGFMF